MSNKKKTAPDTNYVGVLILVLVVVLIGEAQAHYGWCGGALFVLFILGGLPGIANIINDQNKKQ